MEKFTNKNLRLFISILYAVFLCHTVMASIVSYFLFGIFVLGFFFPSNDSTSNALQCLVLAICTIIYMAVVLWANIDTIILLKDIFKNKGNNHVKRRVISMITLLIIPYIIALFIAIMPAQHSTQADVELHSQTVGNINSVHTKSQDIIPEGDTFYEEEF